MDSSNLNVNTPNAALLRRGSAISMSNEINMNNLAGKLQQIRRKSTASMFSSGNDSDFTSSDSESDVEENARRLSGKSSVYSMLSRKSQRRNSKDAQEYDTADFDLTQVILKDAQSFIYEYVLVGTGCSNSYGQNQGISKRIVVASRYTLSILSVTGASTRKYSRTKRNS